MIHYHGSDINPREAFLQFAGRHFCVSYAWPNRVELAHQIGQSVMLDNGAWTFFQQEKEADWNGYLEWAAQWCEFPTTWAIIPDVIGGSGEENDELLAWFLEQAQGHINPIQLTPVWHVGQAPERLVKLCASHWRVCVGSGAWTPGTAPWRREMDNAMDALVGAEGPVRNWLHLLRGLALCGSEYPFSSADSVSMARTHRGDNKIPTKNMDVSKRLTEIDGRQCPARWSSKGSQLGLLEYEIPEQEDYVAKKRSVGASLFDEAEEEDGALAVAQIDLPQPAENTAPPPPELVLSEEELRELGVEPYDD